MRFLENALLPKERERERRRRRRYFYPKAKGSKGLLFSWGMYRVLPKIALIIPKKGPSSSFKKGGRVHDKIQRKFSCFFPTRNVDKKRLLLFGRQLWSPVVTFFSPFITKAPAFGL